MKNDNPLDAKLEAQKNQIPSEVVEATTFVADTLDLCWAAAKAVFEEKATPEQALDIYQFVVERMESKNQ